MGVFEIQHGNRVLEFEASSPQQAVSDYKRLQSLAAEEGPTSLPELTGGFVTRGAMEAAGGVLGGIVGSGASPIAGTIAGGALGVAGGSLLFDNIEDALRHIGVLGGERKTGTDRLAETVGTAAKDAGTDVLMTGGLMAAGQAIRTAKPIIGKFLGLRGEKAEKIVRQAKNAGLAKDGIAQLGAMDVAEGAAGVAARGGMKVFGGFPFIGGPMRRAAMSKAETVISRMNDTLNTLAPNAVMADELGIDMIEAAKGANAGFRTTATRLYDGFRTLARSQGAIFDTKPIKDAVAGVVSDANAQRIVLDDGQVLEGAAADGMNDLLAQWQKMPDLITIDQLQGQADKLKAIVDNARATGFDVKRFMPFKKGLEESMASLNLTAIDPAVGQRIQDAKRTADEFYANGITLFQRPTAKQFGRVDRNLLSVGAEKAGNLNPDQIASAAVNLKSPQAIADLTQLVGRENMGKAARVHMERAWQDSIILKDGQISGIDWNAFKRNVGLMPSTAINKAEGVAGAKALIEAGGVDVKQLEDLIDVASRIELPKDINQFVARRAALGGIASARKALTLGGVFGDAGAISTAGLGFLLRYGGRILSEPKQLEALRRIIAPGDIAKRSALLAKFVEGIPGAMNEIDQAIKAESARNQARALLR